MDDTGMPLDHKPRKVDVEGGVAYSLGLGDETQVTVVGGMSVLQGPASPNGYFGLCNTCT